MVVAEIQIFEIYKLRFSNKIDTDILKLAAMDPETQNFTQAGEKMISYEAKEIIWCNNMDVIAIISSENALEV